MRQYTYADDVVVARKISETDTTITIEIEKQNQNEVTINEGDEFYTMIFVAGKPWERGK